MESQRLIDLALILCYSWETSGVKGEYIWLQTCLSELSLMETECRLLSIAFSLLDFLLNSPVLALSTHPEASEQLRSNSPNDHFTKGKYGQWPFPTSHSQRYFVMENFLLCLPNSMLRDTSFQPPNPPTPHPRFLLLPVGLWEDGIVHVGNYWIKSVHG